MKMTSRMICMVLVAAILAVWTVVLSATSGRQKSVAYAGDVSISTGMGNDLAVTPVPGHSPTASTQRHRAAKRHHVRSSYSPRPSDDAGGYPAGPSTSVSTGMGNDVAVSPLPPGHRTPLQYYPAGK